ncbi:MAG: FtsX-like permease family protein [Dehalococcoidia bacterium]|nr:FtsX-like permease family protein [Dehalococcoidia bacterium]
MNDLFGISMDLIMYVLLGILAVAFLSIAWVGLRNRIMFKMGLRNIPRRRAQTTLIVLGLMLSTVIIAAAFTTGDTVDRSITSEVYSVFGSLDESLQLREEDIDAFEDPSGAFLREQTFPQNTVTNLVASLKDSPSIDFAIPAYSGLAVGLNPRERLSAPEFNVLGLDPGEADGLPDIESTGGARLRLTDLAGGELYLNDSAADELDLAAGDTVQVIIGEQSTSFRVKEIVKDRRLAGAGGISVRREGAVMPLAAAQELFGAPGQLTMIAVSNEGGAREGQALSETAEAEVNAALAAARAASPATPDLSVNLLKANGVEIAEFGANLLTTFFLVFGLFSIGAGILLIFLIFVMLAAERKSEMGMARAVGTKRMDLVQTFLAEGMAYNILAAAVGCALGVLVAFGMSQVMATLLAEIDISISPYVTPRSLIISYSLGVVLTFLTVTFSSWRVSNLNIVRAIRDIPEPPPLKPMWGSRGILISLRDLFFKPTDKHGWRRRGLITLGMIIEIVALASGVTALGFLAAVPILIAFGSFAASQSSLPLGARIGLFVLITLAAPVSLAVSLFMTLQLGPMFTLLSLPLIAMGASDDSTFFLLLGLSLLPLGLAFTLRSFGFNERLLYTAVGVFLIYIWELDFSVGLLEAIFGETTGDIEMFFLSGVMVTIAATFLVVYNADLVLIPLTRIGRGLGALLPSLKMAVAYPLANKMRTGMTLAMFCLVIFALTVMSSLNYNFNKLYLSDSALGGWDVGVDEHPNSPVSDLKAELQAQGSPVANQIDATGIVSVASRFRSLVCQDGFGNDCNVATATAEDSDYDEYVSWGDDAAFLSNSQIPLQSRADGYDNDEAVWQAMAGDPSLIVIDLNALTAGGFGFGVVRGIEPGDATFEPQVLTLYDRQTGGSAKVSVIGVIDQGATATFMAFHVPQPTFDTVFSEPDNRRFFVRTVDGANNVEVARGIESSLLETGAQAESLRQVLNDQNAVQSGFFYLLQGFMGLGLVVGVAAVGVIAFRTVVERRQQIGMLRAIGYTRGMVGLTFLLESAFIAFAGVACGIVFALILARQLITDEFANQGIGFSVPWEQIAIIAFLAFGSALLMTLIPSRQASSIPIAEALRYE